MGTSGVRGQSNRYTWCEGALGQVHLLYGGTLTGTSGVRGHSDRTSAIRGHSDRDFCHEGAIGLEHLVGRGQKVTVGRVPTFFSPVLEPCM